MGEEDVSARRASIPRMDSNNIERDGQRVCRQEYVGQFAQRVESCSSETFARFFWNMIIYFGVIMFARCQRKPGSPSKYFGSCDSFEGALSSRGAK